MATLKELKNQLEKIYKQLFTLSFRERHTEVQLYIKIAALKYRIEKLIRNKMDEE